MRRRSLSREGDQVAQLLAVRKGNCSGENDLVAFAEGSGGEGMFEEIGAGDGVPGGLVELGRGDVSGPVIEDGAFVIECKWLVGTKFERDVADTFGDVAELVGEFDAGFGGIGHDAGEGMEPHFYGGKHIHAGAGELRRGSIGAPTEERQGTDE